MSQIIVFMVDEVVDGETVSKLKLAGAATNVECLEYKNGKISKRYRTVVEIANFTVPQGLPYKIIDDSLLPKDAMFPDSLYVDEADLDSGVGQGSYSDSEEQAVYQQLLDAQAQNAELQAQLDAMNSEEAPVEGE